MLEANNPLQHPHEHYCRPQHTNSTQQHILVTEDSKGMVAPNPVTKMAKAEASLCRPPGDNTPAREAGVLLRDREGGSPTRLRGDRGQGLHTNTNG